MPAQNALTKLLEQKEGIVIVDNAFPQDILDRTWFIGDAVHDMQCGNACGAKSILAHWGPITSVEGDNAAVKEAKFIAATPKEVADIIIH